MHFLSETDEVLSITLSKPCGRQTKAGNNEASASSKVKIRRLDDTYLAERTSGTQVFHSKLEKKDLEAFLAENIPSAFKNAQIETISESITVLTNKKGKSTILRKKKKILPSKTGAVPAKNTVLKDSSLDVSDIKETQLLPAEIAAAAKSLHLFHTHNRQKNYLLKEGSPVPFLVQLGIMTKEGKVHAQKYSKFRQINRFLEYVDDILPELEEETGQAEKAQNATLHDMDCGESQETGTQTERLPEKSPTLEIVDFGCGKSYLTFAVYHYLTVIKDLKAHITGIDLKKDVIEHCRRLAEACRYSGMDFICGDVADFKGSEHPHLVITLHACDTATDYALAYAVKNKAKCILSVPCCQHELNSLVTKHVPDHAFSTMFKYGIIKERLSALATDVMRAELLEDSGYSTQILEFIDMEDTPKNLLIRAIKQQTSSTHTKITSCETKAEGKSAGRQKNEGLQAMKSALGQTITLEKLIE